MARQPSARRFSVGEYYEMARSGILREDDRVELIEGEIVEMPPLGSRHAACVKRLNRLFSSQVGDAAIVCVQDPVRLSKRSEPQPDLALAKPRPDFYAAAHPGAGDIWLLVEVADTSAGYDRSLKIPLYARAGIPEVWLVDLERDLVEVHREPSATGYRSVQIARRGERVRVQALPQVDVAVEAVLG
ncbi:MAG: Uma2 family endonuclease [Chloroflexi bacterium]|nr:Uma2 family endonuclease [Chloroflexota bacterium]